MFGRGGFLSAIVPSGRGFLSKCNILSSASGKVTSNQLLKSSPAGCGHNLDFVRQPHDIGHFRSFKWRPSKATHITRYNGYSIHKRIRSGRRGVEIMLKKISNRETFIAPYLGLRWKKHVYSPLIRFRPEGGPVDPKWKPLMKPKDYMRYHRPDPIDPASTKKTPHGYLFDYSGVGRMRKKMPPVEMNKYITAVDPQFYYKPTTAR